MPPAQAGGRARPPEMREVLKCDLLQPAWRLCLATAAARVAEVADRLSLPARLAPARVVGADSLGAAATTPATSRTCSSTECLYYRRAKGADQRARRQPRLRRGAEGGRAQTAPPGRYARVTAQGARPCSRHHSSCRWVFAVGERDRLVPALATRLGGQGRGRARHRVAHRAAGLEGGGRPASAPVRALPHCCGAGAAAAVGAAGAAVGRRAHLRLAGALGEE